MGRFALRVFASSCLAWMAFAGAAAADRAPIVYAGQGGASTRPVSLVGGDENSYGYGAQQSGSRQRAGAVIDIRRSSSAPREPAFAAAAQPAPAAEEGARPDWLEQERVGPPYEANGRWYAPTPEPGYAESGVASWYGPQFHGQRAANGEVYDQEGMTAAHPTLPLNSLVQVTNLENGREVILRITDRGPFVGERLIDLSHAAAVVLGFERAGQTRVHVRYLGPAPRRVNADGLPVAPAQPPAAAEDEGPASLLPPPAPAREPVAAPQYASAPAAAPAPSYQPVSAVMGGYYVQVGAFADLDNAHRVRASLEAAGPVVVEIRETAAGELYRVRVGPWASRAEAENARQHVASLGFGESVVAQR